MAKMTSDTLAELRDSYEQATEPKMSCPYCNQVIDSVIFIVTSTGLGKLKDGKWHVDKDTEELDDIYCLSCQENLTSALDIGDWDFVGKGE